MNNQEFTNQEQVQIINAVRAGVAATKHHANYSARVEKVIETKIKEIFPNAVVSFVPGASSLGSIGVWREDYCNRLYMCWNWSCGNHWSDPILNSMNFSDCSDTMERIEQEKSLDVMFTILESEARDLAEQLDRVRERANNLVKALPVPKSATVRAKSNFWDHPQPETRARYSTLFPK